ncbi:exodeoxyribonuclease VII large subunit [Motilimonas sp. KMU-193]|uniref:exodeoxyribonuclease VII large subunit n=1 Tax=Motilimonas sp. KMU-193 TaxID=3388668 RepID=UPI00396AF605
MVIKVQSIYSVSRLNKEVKQLLETGLGTVWLSGEISNLTMAASGHWYLTLKDDQAQVRCAMFRGANSKVSLRPKNGLQVLVRAKLSLYEPRGDYQLILESMAPEGEGLLQQAFDALKFKLAAQGLFASQHKQALPAHPTRVGLITSATGAAVHDILSVLKRRNPSLHIIIYPSQVQGKAATPQLINAIQLANQRNEVDLLVLGRGGGSMEDLWCFNEEALARAVFDSTLPIISAVGHEVDVTICDFVADVRAATSSAAAELLSQDAQYWNNRISEQQHRLKQGMLSILNKLANQLKQQQLMLTHHEPRAKLQLQAQRLDELELRLHRGLRHMLSLRQTKLSNLQNRLSQTQPLQRISRLQVQHEQLCQRLTRGMTSYLKQSQQQQKALLQQLHTVSPLATLARGYSITTDSQGKVIDNSEQLSQGDLITTRFAQGEIVAKVQ